MYSIKIEIKVMKKVWKQQKNLNESFRKDGEGFPEKVAFKLRTEG